MRDTTVKENLIRCVDLIGKSLHPAHLKTDKFILHRREELLGHMQARDLIRAPYILYAVKYIGLVPLAHPAGQWLTPWHGPCALCFVWR